jgi:hypothetical protein
MMFVDVSWLAAGLISYLIEEVLDKTSSSVGQPGVS